MENQGRVALVTGANGFVGSHLVAKLLERGYSVRAMVRTTSDLTALDGMDVEYVNADVTDPQSLPTALAGVQVVFHVAGLTRTKRSKEYFRVNDEGTGSLVTSCLLEPGIERFVYISSGAATGPSWKSRSRVEDDPPEPVGPYGESKLAGERTSVEIADGRIPVVIVRPCAVYGPWEKDMLKLYKMARRGIAPVVAGDTCMSMIHAGDLADLIERAGRVEAACGRTYFAADPSPYWLSNVLGIMGSLFGKRVVRIPVPPRLLWPVALINEQLLKAGIGADVLTRTRIREFRERFWVFDSSRAKEELGWKPAISLEEGMRRTAEWYLSKGWL